MKRKEFLQSGFIAAGLSVLPDALSAKEQAPKKSFRFAFISDIHIKTGAVPEAGMSKALRHVNQLKPKVDFIINGGDCIMDALAATKESTQTQWALYHQIMQKENSLPVYPCIGNHDIYGWFQKAPDVTDPLYGKNYALKELKMTERYYHSKKENWNFIILDSTQLNPAGGYIAKIDDIQLEWLKNKLAEIPANQQICIVSHIPILSICAGLFFNKTEANGDLMIKRNLMHTDFFALKTLFNKYPNIKTCLSGHIHLQDEIHYNNVDYYCNGAISGNWWGGAFQEFDPAYAVFDFFDDGTVKREMIKYDI
ncbi:metallophosphoesterase [Pedobacter frigiditerrae]|uniref:Metallophosphoesterase n=1 Tax=Pedobacter frigiditerrae TaxID=2530452 RepID=A0A4R0MMN2_9SPHI|nr:metallophosphoesterase [Pedobacter frigiditerrae]TCC87975.1 metallophosphoesterase [Pedobacter frigiditerrae]